MFKKIMFMILFVLVCIYCFAINTEFVYNAEDFQEALNDNIVEKIIISSNLVGKLRMW